MDRNNFHPKTALFLLTALNLLNYAVYFADSRIELYGSEGTVVYRQRGDAILTGRAGDEALKPVEIPAEYDSPWKVEEEFVRLVRSEIDAMYRERAVA